MSVLSRLVSEPRRVLARLHKLLVPFTLHEVLKHKKRVYRVLGGYRVKMPKARAVTHKN